MKESSSENLLFYIGEYAKKVGRLTTRPILLTFAVKIVTICKAKYKGRFY